MAFAAPLSDIAGKDCEEAVNVLTELGVVQGYPDGSFKPEKVVTRAEMAVIVVSALGLEDYAVGTAKFSDMAGHWSNGYVAYAASLGIIAGYPDGTFKPDAIVSYDEAATMLVAALGYTADSLIGTWPANYVSKAKTLGILDGIKSGAAGANRGDIAIMAYQTLDQTIGKTNKDGDFVFDDKNPDTMLDRLGAKLYDPAGDGEGKEAGDPFVMTNTIADAAKTNVKNYLGAYVTAYADSKNKVIAVKEVKTTFLDGKMKDGKFKAGDVSYKVTELSDPFTAYEFVNGVVSNSALSVDRAAIPESVIAAELDGNYLDAVYSVMVWNITAHAKITDKQLDAIDDEKLLSKNFKTTSKDEIDLKSFDLVGVDSLDAIKKDNIVYVYVGGDYITKVEVGTEVVSGEITRIASNGDITVNGKAYALADKEVADDSILKVENEVKLYLDVDGDIYDVKLIEGEADNLAIVLDQDPGTPGLNGTDTKLKLFLADGTTKTFVVDRDEYEIDEFKAIITDAAIDTIIEYAVGKDGEITKIESYTGDDLKIASPASITAKGYVAGYKISADATVFTGADVTGDWTFVEGDDEYGVSTLAKVLDAKYDAVLYNVNDDGIVDLLVIEGAGTGSDAVYGVLNDTFETSDWDYGVELLIDGAFKEYNATTNVTDDKELYEITFNTDGEAVMEKVDDTLDAFTVESVDNDRAYKSGSGSVALDSDIIVYVYDAADGWSVGDVDDLEGEYVVFFATDDDEPNVATIALVGLSI